jgi:PKD repeat protein
VTGGGTYCMGGWGASVCISGSETGVKYTLIKDSITTTTTLDGTGWPLYFYGQTAGTYMVSGNRTGTCITDTMAGSAIITETEFPTDFIADKLTPLVNENVHLTDLSGSEATFWSWSFNRATVVYVNGTGSTSQNPEVQFTECGLYTVSLYSGYMNPMGTCTGTEIKSDYIRAGLPGQPVPTITGLTPVCAGTTGVTYTTEAGMTGYVWTISAGGTITSGTGTNVITVTWNTAGAENVSVNYFDINGCTAAVPTSYPVILNPLPVPAITGPASVCLNSTGNVYTTESGMTNYIWTVTGGTITAGGGTTSNTATVTWTSSGTQSISVNYTNTNGCTAATATSYSVTVFPSAPPAHGNITGPNSVCQGTQGVAYSIAPVLYATGYFWIFTGTGGTVASGQNTTSITVNFSNTATDGKVQVYAYNACGNGPTSPSLNVSLWPVPTAPVISYNQPKNRLTSDQPSNNQWYLDGIAIAGATDKNYTPVVSGDYTDIITKHGCSSPPSNIIHVTLAKSFTIADNPDNKGGTELLVYPTPNQGLFTYEITLPEAETLSMVIYNNIGIKVFEETNLKGEGVLQGKIDLQQMPDGIYILHLQGEKTSILRKIVIRK